MSESFKDQSEIMSGPEQTILKETAAIAAFTKLLEAVRQRVPGQEK